MPDFVATLVTLVNVATAETFREDECLGGCFLRWALTEVREQLGQIRKPNLAIPIEIFDTSVARLPPCGEQDREISESNLAIAIKIRRAWILALIQDAVPIEVLRRIFFDLTTVLDVIVVAV